MEFPAELVRGEIVKCYKNLILAENLCSGGGSLAFADRQSAAAAEV